MHNLQCNFVAKCIMFEETIEINIIAYKRNEWKKIEREKKFSRLQNKCQLSRDQW